MIAIALCVSVVSAAPKLAVMPLSGVQIEPALLAYAGEQLGEALTKRNLRVVTPQDMQSVLGFERQKQLLGCSENSSSCLAELSGALGADALATGTLARLGSKLQLTVKILEPRDGRRLASASLAASSEEDLPEVIDRAAAALVAEWLASKSVAPVASADAVQPGPPSPPRGLGFWLPVGAGAAALAGGAVLLVSANASHDALTRSNPDLPRLNPDEAGRAFDGIMATRNAGIGVAAAGAAAIVGGFLVHALSGGPATVSLAPAGSGASVVVMGSWR